MVLAGRHRRTHASASNAGTRDTGGGRTSATRTASAADTPDRSTHPAGPWPLLSRRRARRSVPHDTLTLFSISRHSL